MNKHNPDTSYFSYPICTNEVLRKTPVTQTDINQTIKLLREFHLKVPDNFDEICSGFKSYADLEIWRRSYIIRNLI